MPRAGDLANCTGLHDSPSATQHSTKGGTQSGSREQGVPSLQGVSRQALETESLGSCLKLAFYKACHSGQLLTLSEGWFPFLQNCTSEGAQHRAGQVVDQGMMILFSNSCCLSWLSVGQGPHQTRHTAGAHCMGLALLRTHYSRAVITFTKLTCALQIKS